MGAGAWVGLVEPVAMIMHGHVRSHVRLKMTSSVQCSETRRFRHVSWKSGTSGRCQSGWVAQHCGQTIGGFHETQEAAGHALRLHLGLASLACLPKPRQKARTASRTTSRVAGVHYHRQKHCFVSTTTGGLHTTVGKACGGNPNEFKRGLMPKTILARTRFLNKVFDKGEVPADLEDLYRRAKWIASASKDEPVIALLMVQLKYGPWRAALESAWKHLRTTTSSVQGPKSEAARAARLLDALTAVVHVVSKERVSKSWSRNAGRFVGRHAGAEQVLRHLGVLKTASRGMSFWSAAGSDDDDDNGEDNSEHAQVSTKWVFGSRPECDQTHANALMNYGGSCCLIDVCVVD